MEVGLFFGSFNPVHIGHLVIANTMLTCARIKQVWFVVSPQNPLKNKAQLASEYDRLRMAELAIEDNDGFRVSNIEFSLPKPSYTIDTLQFLEERHKNYYTFSLIMGSDNLLHFHKWKNYSVILENYSLLVYQRPGSEKSTFHNHSAVTIVNAPVLHISATAIRKTISSSKSIRYLVPKKVEEYIRNNNLYKPLKAKNK